VNITITSSAHRAPQGCAAGGSKDLLHAGHGACPGEVYLERSSDESFSER
jgi:hypothetical protein